LASSAVAICNSALIKLGEPNLITSLSDQTKAARLCNQLYETLRDDVLRAHPWNFALARVELAQITAPVLFEFDHAYQLPADCLRVVKVDGDFEYKIEGRHLLTNHPEVNILYVKQVTDPGEYDTNFQEALSCRIAMEIAYAMTNSNTVAEQMESLYQRRLSDARTFDAQEGTPDQIEATEWLYSRF
jgi:hypothetical protein